MTQQPTATGGEVLRELRRIRTRLTILIIITLVPYIIYLGVGLVVILAVLRGRSIIPRLLTP